MCAIHRLIRCIERGYEWGNWWLQRLALNCFLDLPNTSRRKTLLAAIQGHLLQDTVLVGNYKKIHLIGLRYLAVSGKKGVFNKSELLEEVHKWKESNILKFL